jgi:pimeloyl-ACP methyl ester carboxylesterase
MTWTGIRHAQGHVVAHSYGANAALLAAQSEPALIRTLTLLEPACFDLARGKPAVEEHIAAMTPVFVAANDPAVSTREFSRLFGLFTIEGVGGV